MSEPCYLVTTGAESSGKTTLARQLAAALAAPLVEEASRPWLNARLAADPHYRYQAADLAAIGACQCRDELAVHLTAPTHIVCDTDLLVLLIWHEERFGPCDPTLLTLFEQSLAAAPRHYFLCDWQIPWEADPLRENPHDRDRLFQRYMDELEQRQLPYTLVSGSPEERLAQALAQIPRQHT